MPFLPVMSISRSQNVRIGSAQLGVTGYRVPGEIGDTVAGVTPLPFYVDISGTTSRRDLQNHMATGAVIVVGSLTNTSSPYFWSAAPAVTANNPNVNVAAGTLVPRLYNAVIAGYVQTAQASISVPAVTSLAVQAADPVLDRTDLVYAASVNGVWQYAIKTGTPVTAGTSGANTVPTIGTGQVPVAWYKVLNTAAGVSSITAIAPTS